MCPERRDRRTLERTAGSGGWAITLSTRSEPSGSHCTQIAYEPGWYASLLAFSRGSEIVCPAEPRPSQRGPIPPRGPTGPSRPGTRLPEVTRAASGPIHIFHDEFYRAGTADPAPVSSPSFACV